MSKSLASRWVILVFTWAIATTTSAQTAPARALTEFSIVGQNLLRPRHAEFPDAQLIDQMLDQRSFFGKLTWRF